VRRNAKRGFLASERGKLADFDRSRAAGIIAAGFVAARGGEKQQRQRGWHPSKLWAADSHKIFIHKYALSFGQPPDHV
jgi:hypothetical protein